MQPDQCPPALVEAARARRRRRRQPPQWEILPGGGDRVQAFAANINGPGHQRLTARLPGAWIGDYSSPGGEQ